MEVFIKLVKPPKITEDISETRRNNHKGFTSQTSLICDEEIQTRVKTLCTTRRRSESRAMRRPGVNI